MGRRGRVEGGGREVEAGWERGGARGEREHMNQPSTKDHGAVL